MATSAVHYLWQLGSWRIWSYWICRIHRGLLIKTLVALLKTGRRAWKIWPFGVESIVHPQEYFSKLSERAVAYINVDISVFGTSLCFSSFNIFIPCSTCWNAWCPPQLMPLSELLLLQQHRVCFLQPPNRWGTSLVSTPFPEEWLSCLS